MFKKNGGGAAAATTTAGRGSGQLSHEWRERSLSITSSIALNKVVKEEEQRENSWRGFSAAGAAPAAANMSSMLSSSAASNLSPSFSSFTENKQLLFSTNSSGSNRVPIFDDFSLKNKLTQSKQKGKSHTQKKRITNQQHAASSEDSSPSFQGIE